MNRTAKRFGKAAADLESAKAGKDSSHGKAMVTPAPRRTARREMRCAEFGFRLGILFTFLSRKYAGLPRHSLAICRGAPMWAPAEAWRSGRPHRAAPTTLCTYGFPALGCAPVA